MSESVTASALAHGALPLPGAVAGGARAAKPGAPALDASRAAEQKRLLEVAQEFESLLISILMKSMRATVPQSELMGGSSEVRTYQELQDQQIALEMAQCGGLGLAPLIARQLDRASGDAEDAAAEAAGAVPVDGAKPADPIGAAKAALATAHEAGRRALVEQALYTHPLAAGGMPAPIPMATPAPPQEDR